MSMASQVMPWLWEMLNWDCGLNQGRAALLPNRNIAIASFQVLSESGDWHQLKMISSAGKIERVDEEGTREKVALKVENRRKDGGHLQYHAHFSDGSDDWLTADHFIDDDGTATLSWLSFADEEDLRSAFSSFTQAQLKVCHHFQNYSSYLIMLHS
jgi:hypothetical protein